MSDILVRQLAEALRARQWMVTVAESCTGGGLAATLTDVPGASDWFAYGFVTYADQAKQDLLGVPATTLLTHGAVSEATVLAMARGAQARANAQVSVAISGVAGPGGGSENKPVGLVWFGFAGPNAACAAQAQQFSGDRLAIRQQAIGYALHKLLHYCEVGDVV